MSEHSTTSVERRKLLENAYGQIAHKAQVPEIDFSVYTMEDGEQVSTRERVIKDVHCLLYTSPSPRDRG